MSVPALATRGLDKSFGSLVVARGVELALPQGERYALIGPNGAGKTTLINLITGMLYGGLIGAVIFMVARDQFSGINPQYWYFWIGLLLVATVMLLPNGILGGLSALYRVLMGRFRR